ncbi:MAG: hypothetical protein Kow00121_42920 [Elainellaceae cyanobacterium]
MTVKLTEATIAECQSLFNLSYHVPFAYRCQQMVGFEGKNVLEVGGSLPKEFVLDYLKVNSWSAIESPDYEAFLQNVEGTPHEGSVIHQRDDLAQLGFHDRELEDYSLFFAYIEDLPEEHYGKYDLIFSLSAFEHIQKFPKALEKMYLALKPAGQLFSMFSPIWSAHDGHHLPNVVDQQGREFNFYNNNPIPPWGHLLMRPPELCQYLYQVTDKEAADLITYYVYNSPQINRFFTEDYVAFFQQSEFTIQHIDLTFNAKPQPAIQETLERLYPGRSAFSNNGLLVILGKDAHTSISSASVDKINTSTVMSSTGPDSEHPPLSVPPSIPNRDTPTYSVNTMETQLYTRSFYDSLHEGSRQSAQIIVPLIMELLQPESVLDVGCGTGNWLAVFNEFGVQDYLGIDGDYVDLEALQIPKDRFIPHDLKVPFELNQKFDLVMSVEVAEHLPAELADSFVQSLTRLSSVVLFSAAIPYQGGTGHINEQWLEYWVEIFQRQGYIAIDCLRDKIWSSAQVKPWYAQNLLIFVQQEKLALYPRLVTELGNKHTASPQSKVHPWIYLNSLSMQQQAVTQSFANNNPLGVTTLIQRYREDSSSKALENLRQFRQQLAQFWLNAIDEQLETVYKSELGQAYQTLLNSGIRCQPLVATEQEFVDQLLKEFDGEVSTAQAVKKLLVLLLYARMYDVPLKLDLPSVPAWFLDVYLSFLLEAPQMFQVKGEAERYYQYMKEVVDYLHTNILGNTDSAGWQRVAQFFTAKTSFLPLYFSDQNLREINRKRAEIIEFTLVATGYELDYEFPERPANRSKIRLGILKNHFNPQTETFLTIPAFEYLDRNQFEIFLYTTHGHPHPMEQYCESHANKLVYLPPNLTDQANLIRSDDLDILIFGTNVTIQTNDICQLVAHRLARVQTTLYSSPVTTGLRHVDYYISGDLTEPSEGAQDYYNEQLLTLEGTGYCFYYGDEPKPTKTNLTRESVGIPVDAVVFTSGANFFKIIPEVREAWAKILAAVPNSVLVLYPFSLSWSLNYAKQAFLENFYTIFDRYGITKDRLVILDSMPIRADVKEHLKLADVYLDSFPYTGSFSTSDPLEVFLPSVVLSGATLRSRQGSALLRDIEMPELIANNEAEYIQIAIELGNNTELRQQKRQQMQRQMQNNPRFFDRRNYSAQIGSLCQELFQTYQTNQTEIDYRLRAINLLALPDWNQTEADLFAALVDLLRQVLTHPNRSQITLLIAVNHIDQEVADELVGSVIMQLLTEEGLEVGDEEPEIALVSNLSVAKWQMLLPYLSAQIPLAQEDAIATAQLQQVINMAGKPPLPTFEMLG